MPQSYADLTRRSSEEDFIARVRACILHTAVLVKIKVAPTAAEAPADALGRSVVADPDGWSRRFAWVIAVILIGSADLSPTSVSDADLFSATDAAWPKFYPQPPPV